MKTINNPDGSRSFLGGKWDWPVGSVTPDTDKETKDKLQVEMERHSYRFDAIADKMGYVNGDVKQGVKPTHPDAFELWDSLWSEITESLGL